MARIQNCYHINRKKKKCLIDWNALEITDTDPSVSPNPHQPQCLIHIEKKQQLKLT